MAVCQNMQNVSVAISCYLIYCPYMSRPCSFIILTTLYAPATLFPGCSLFFGGFFFNLIFFFLPIKLVLEQNVENCYVLHFKGKKLNDGRDFSPPPLTDLLCEQI